MDSSEFTPSILFRYFTTWAFLAVLVAVLMQMAMRFSGCGATFAAQFIVLVSTLVGTVGTWVVTQNMCVKGIGLGNSKITRMGLNIHLWMHMLPMALAIIILCTWKYTCGPPPEMRGTICAIICLAILVTSYLSTPLSSGAKWLKKVQEVYDVRDAGQFVLVGGGITALASMLLLTYGRMLASKRR